MIVTSGEFGHVCSSKIDKIEVYLSGEMQVGCTHMDRETGSGTDIAKHALSAMVEEQLQNNREITARPCFSDSRKH